MDENEIIFSHSTVKKNRIIVVISIIFPILFFLPLVKDDESSYCRFFANQSLLILILYFLCALIPIIGWFILSIGVFILQIKIIISAFKGQSNVLPVIGEITIIK